VTELFLGKRRSPNRLFFFKGEFMRLRSLFSLSTVLFVVSCGAKKSATSTPPATPDNTVPDTLVELKSIDSGSKAVGFAMAALTSSGKASPSSGLNLETPPPPTTPNQTQPEGPNQTQSDGETEKAHDVFKQCSENAGAFKTDGSGRLNETDAGYSERTIFCQLNVDSGDSIIGSLSIAKKVLCTTEKSIGAEVVYTADGKVYSDVKLNFSKECGWTDKQITEIGTNFPVVKLTATSFTEGDWQKGVRVEVPGMLDFNLFYSIKGSVVAIKKVEGWSQADRCAEQGSGCNSIIPTDAKGSRGDVISVDLKSGEMRAETTDNYWGRRARALFKGSLDSKSGEFSSIEDVNFIFSDTYANTVDGSVFVSGKVASAKGSVKSGIAFVGGRIACGEQNNSCSLENFSTAGKIQGPGVECSVSGGCVGNTGFDWAFSNTKLQEFLKLGAFFDSNTGSRSKNEEWLKAAKIPTFTSVDFSSTLD
jgi:hypothetical protein